MSLQNFLSLTVLCYSSPPLYLLLHPGSSREMERLSEPHCWFQPKCFRTSPNFGRTCAMCSPPPSAVHVQHPLRILYSNPGIVQAWSPRKFSVLCVLIPNRDMDSPLSYLPFKFLVVFIFCARIELHVNPRKDRTTITLSYFFFVVGFIA